MSFEVNPKINPPLDSRFVPASLWNRAYRTLAGKQNDARQLTLSMVRDEDCVFSRSEPLLPDTAAFAEDNFRFVERMLKFLLWQKGGWKVVISGADEVVVRLQSEYAADGARHFDHRYMGQTMFDRDFVIETCPESRIPEERHEPVALGRNLEGCRIGFDLGGSDRKAAALIDGKVVFSEEIEWDPYFQSDPDYHFQGICDTLRRAAGHLPRVDAVGGSAAGVYVNNKVRAASLFRGVPESLFADKVVPIFFQVMEEMGWADIPWQVVNDGEVTALAGSMSLGVNSILGVSMGTSQAAGYVGGSGNIRPWLNELAFAPVDYSQDAPMDEWSGDRGCGVQYFSQQAVARLVKPAGFDVEENLGYPEILVKVQEAMENGDSRALKIYETIGVYFGYALMHYADYYDMENVLILGRVTSGPGGEHIIECAQRVLQKEDPALHEKLRLTTPGEKDKRHGQAIAAASLPELAPES